MNKKLKFITSLPALLLALTVSANAQIAINGPVCVVPGVTYQYILTGTWADSTGMQLCISGGILTSSGKTCENGVVMSDIKVKWDSATQGSISIQSAAGNASLPVTITSILNPGLVEASKRKQVIEHDATPATIEGTAATGGSCLPEYIYQWQRSPDNVSWNDIEGATAEQLFLPGKYKQTMYYRRKVTEANSNTVAFTKVAVVFVNPDMTGRQ